MDDLIGEILLRLPPEDPQCLVHTSLICKPWRNLLSYPGFPRRYREFHGSPPLLGFLHNQSHRRRKKKYRGSRFFSPRFVPIKQASPFRLNPRLEADCYILDCRHGRVLLYESKKGLIVWDPVTNSHNHIGQPIVNGSLYDFSAAVLCDVDACDHLGCRGGPSLVVFIEIDRPFGQGASASAMVYSKETGAWKAGVQSIHLGSITYGRSMVSKTIGSSLLADDAIIYFVLEEGRRILKYDIAGCGLSLMSTPPLPVWNMVLMKADGAGLGFCALDGDSLNLWAWQIGPRGVCEWEKGRVIQLDIGHLSTKLDVVDFAEGAGSIFVRANNGVFAVDLKSGRARKIGKGRDFKDIFPFMSFYTPEIMLQPL